MGSGLSIHTLLQMGQSCKTYMGVRFNDDPFLPTCIQIGLGPVVQQGPKKGPYILLTLPLNAMPWEIGYFGGPN